MMPRGVKAGFYVACGPFMRANGWLYRTLRAPRTEAVRVQLGPGQGNYLPGWVNVDANMFTGRCDVWADLRNPLPFHDETVDAMYSHHVVEHLPSLVNHLADVFRCLKPDGVYRLGGPNGDSAIRRFMENDNEWFSSFPDDRSSIGGRFENFVFCRGEHLTVLTYSFLEELMSKVGFVDISRCLPVKETNYPDRFSPCLEKEWETDYEAPHTLVVEARKPRRLSSASQDGVVVEGGR
jgi:predicted SAM-dependent methyltransferase